MQQQAFKPIVLVILDGWGYAKDSPDNAITRANTPNWHKWWASMPHALLNASGSAVGLPADQMGNSEVGHMHIGAGRLIQQELTRINQAIADHNFANNQEFINLLAALKNNKKNLHILGLLSPGGVHAHEDHIFALLDVCAANNFYNVVVHAILDGRDTPPRSATHSLIKLQQKLSNYKEMQIGSISGRYYAMDRDKRWDRTALYIKTLISGTGLVAADPITALNKSYQANRTDEFVIPTHIANSSCITDGDAIFFANFRADRARQLTAAFLTPHNTEIDLTSIPKLQEFWSMTKYADELPTKVLFPFEEIKVTLGSIISDAGLKQLRIAETEKYAHVTFFFNGGVETLYPGEDRILIPSPKTATYEEVPKMSAADLTTQLIAAINSQKYGVIIANYANADMVGHTGNFEATRQAITFLDECLGRVYDAISMRSGILLITADHGNAEAMYDPDSKQPHTAHTHNLVPFLCVSDNIEYKKNYQGSLIDIAPTVLQLLNLKVPDSMQGQPVFWQI